MSDRIEVLLAVPVDDALPGDVQGVALRRNVINLMKEIAEVDENTVRYKGFSLEATVNWVGDDRFTSLWQHNLIAFRYIADGTADKELDGDIVHMDAALRVYSRASVNRNPYAA